MERSLSQTFNLINKEELLLPDFQRDYKWNISKQQSLLASIMLNFPVGSSLVLKGNSKDFALRKIGENIQSSKEESRECEYLLDGQQRTTTLYNAFNDLFDVFEFSNRDDLTKFISRKANPMKTRWFIRIPVLDKSNKGITDLFNSTTLLFDKNSLNNIEPDDIVDIFSCETFHEKNNLGVRRWFSPYYQLDLYIEKKSKPKVITQFVDDCIENGLVPLFMISAAAQDMKDSAHSVIERILEGIADHNMQSIRDSHDNDFLLIKKHYDSAHSFEGIESLEELENSGRDFHKESEKIFTSCKSRWVNSILNYLIGDIFEGYKLSSLVTDDIRRAIPIFCHLNDGGMKLDDFDLVSARVAQHLDGDIETYSLGSNIRETFSKPLLLSSHIQAHCNSSNYLRLENLDNLSEGLPSGYLSKAILAICAALAQRQIKLDTESKIELTKNDTSSRTLLKLSPRIIRDHILTAAQAVQRAYAFLLTRCGVYNSNKLHYKLMIQPIAYVFAEDRFWDSQTAHNKVEFWYWSSAFSGRYLYDQSAVVIDDMNQLYNWVSNGNGDDILRREDMIFKDDKYSSKKLLMQELVDHPKEGIHNFILQYTLSLNPSYDLLANETKELNAYMKNIHGDILLRPANSNDSLNDHHIIPLGSVTELGQATNEIRQDPNHILNSPLNRVLISSSANSKIRSMDPARYFNDIPANNIVMKKLLIGSSFNNISTAATEQDIRNALSERFDALEQSVKERLLDLKTSIQT